MKTKYLPLLLLFLCMSSPLLAQQPVITLSASIFYQGDAPGTYTITCPTNTSAAISALTKIADVPLLYPATNQYGIGVTFPWPSASKLDANPDRKSAAVFYADSHG